MEHGGWLSKDELVFNRMATFHSERVGAVAVGSSPLHELQGGTLVVHLIPISSVSSRLQFEGNKLKEHGEHIRPLGGHGGYSRFNVDGYLNYNRDTGITAYSQIFRDGRLESAMTDIAYNQNGAHVIRDIICEKAAFELASTYLKFCANIGLEPPIWMFSALVGCEGFRFEINRGFHDLSDRAVDRSPAYLPEIEILRLDIEPTSFLRPWCDTLWQAGGVQQSLNFDREGIRHERR
jgi:hypothetical protein